MFLCFIIIYKALGRTKKKKEGEQLSSPSFSYYVRPKALYMIIKQRNIFKHFKF